MRIRNNRNYGRRRINEEDILFGDYFGLGQIKRENEAQEKLRNISRFISKTNHEINKNIDQFDYNTELYDLLEDIARYTADANRKLDRIIKNGNFKLI